MFKPEYFSSTLDAAIPVILAARSFIIPIPRGIGQPLVYPFDIDGETEMKKGMPILDGNGQPMGTGVVFTNYTDGAIQAVRDGGAHMIIVNGVTENQANTLFAYYMANIRDPKKATAQDIHSVLTYAHQQLGIEDFFDGKRRKIPEFDVVSLHPNCTECGIFIRRSEEKRFALLGLGSGTFKGPADSPQRFEGNVAVLTNGKHTWMVQTSAFLDTYQHPDKQKINIRDLPAFKMQEGSPPVLAAFTSN
jgi:hypothetical protein